VLHTPYSLDNANKPTIVSINGGNGVPTLSFNSFFTVKWDGPAVTGVALVAPSTDTHGFNNNQRVVFLRITERNDGAKSLTIRSPNMRGVAPPQSYLLFLLNGKTYSRARWVRLA
jgi:hypothetical protein